MAAYWVGTSWKMNKTLAEALAFAAAMAEVAPRLDPAIQPFVIPPFTAVREVKRALAASRVQVGAQNMHWANAGPWTGEISPPMLVDCQLDLVELGHSERRRNFGETDHMVGLKVAAALRHGLRPLICVGETLAERDAGQADDVLAAQVAGALHFLDGSANASRLLFAYEPVWAIGAAGVAADARYAGRKHAHIRSVAARLLRQEAPPVLYGGSVSAANAAEFIRERHVEGLFIGRAAWDVAGFIDILQCVETAIGHCAAPDAREETV